MPHMSRPADQTRVALVTGATRRIGAAIATRLARDGWRTALHTSPRAFDETREIASQLQREGHVAQAFAADLANPDDVARLIPNVVRQMGPVTLLVNNASVFEPDLVETFEPARLDRHMAVNLRAPVQLARALAAQLPENMQGAIVNLLDQRVLKPTPQLFSYSLSKAALWTATRTLAQALAPRIRVNGVGPGPVFPNPVDGPEAFAREIAAIPLRHSVDPEEIADAIVWLGNARSVTGQMIAVDAGQHIGWRTPDINE